MSLQWNENLASGSMEIDAQHKELFSRINNLLASFDKEATDLQELGKIVQYLSDYVVYHFGTEEKNMEHYRYSSTAQHKAQHEQFVKTFEKLKTRLAREGFSKQLGGEITDLCVDWLLNHIKYSDRALGMFLKLKA